jgi:hypothetical protein
MRTRSAYPDHSASNEWREPSFNSPVLGIAGSVTAFFGRVSGEKGNDEGAGRMTIEHGGRI